MKHLLYLLFLISPPLFGAEIKKAVPNPWTNRLDWIINIGSTSVGAMVDVSTASLSGGQCLVWNGTSLQFEAGSCGSGGSSLVLVVSTNGVVISSPTTRINFMPPFTGSLDGSTTAQISLDVSSVTLQGQSVLSFSSATATYLQLSSAIATYLQNSSATVTYLQLSSAAATYLNTNDPTVTKLGSTIEVSEISDVNAGTDLTADLEEEAHATEHQNGGADEINVAGLDGLLGDTQEITVATNSFTIGRSTGLNFIEGSNVTLSATETGNTVNLTIAAASGGGGDNLGNHVATKTITAGFGIDATTGVFTTSVQLPNGTGPTIDAVGEMAVDTTSNQLLWYDGVNDLVVPSTFSKSMAMENPSDDDFPYFWKPHKDINLLYAVCVSSANSLTLSIQECDANGTSCSRITNITTCGTTEANVPFTDTSVAAGNRIRLKIETANNTKFSTIDVYYRETRK